MQIRQLDCVLWGVLLTTTLTCRMMLGTSTSNGRREGVLGAV